MLDYIFDPGKKNRPAGNGRLLHAHSHSQSRSSLVKVNKLGTKTLFRWQIIDRCSDSRRALHRTLVEDWRGRRRCRTHNQITLICKRWWTVKSQFAKKLRSLVSIWCVVSAPPRWREQASFERSVTWKGWTSTHLTCWFISYLFDYSGNRQRRTINSCCFPTSHSLFTFATSCYARHHRNVLVLSDMSREWVTRERNVWITGWGNLAFQAR